MAEKAGTNGLATAVALAGGMGELGVEGAEQVELFADADDAPMPMPAAKGVSGPQGGRPRGARNRSTEEWRHYILSRYRSPLVFLMELAARSPADLARDLGLYKYHEGKLVTAEVEDQDGTKHRVPVLDTGAAFSAQVDAAKAALPYLHQRQPLAIEAKGDARGLLVLGDLNVTQAAGMGLTLPLADNEENQGVIDIEPEKSHDEKSHEDPSD